MLYLKNILIFSGLPREPVLCQLYRHSFKIPYSYGYGIIGSSPACRESPSLLLWLGDKTQRAESRGGRKQGWGSCEGQPAPPARGSGERCKIPSGVLGKTVVIKKFSCILEAPVASPETSCGPSCLFHHYGSQPSTCCIAPLQLIAI